MYTNINFVLSTINYNKVLGIRNTYIFRIKQKTF